MKRVKQHLMSMVLTGPFSIACGVWVGKEILGLNLFMIYMPGLSVACSTIERCSGNEW